MSSNFYNLALDCIDKHAQSWINKNKLAWVGLRADATLGDPPQFHLQKLSYANLQGLTNRMANALRDLGVQAGERVLLRLPNSSEFPITFLAAVKIGAIPVPTSPLLTLSELRFLLEDSQATVLVSAKSLFPAEFLQNKPETLRHILLVKEDKEEALPSSIYCWQDLLKKSSSNFQTTPTLADAPAFWLYTSGTTDKPKAVIHAHRSIRAHDERARLWQNIQAGDVVFNSSALNWSYALTAGMLDVWRHGQTSVAYQGELKPEILCEVLRVAKVTTLMSVPGIYRKLLPKLREDPVSFARVRVCLSAGESLSEEVAEEFRSLSGLEIYEGLGMTEHSVYLIQPWGEKKVPHSCGRALPGQRIAILREDLSEAAAGEAGILATHRSCEGLFLGYHSSSSASSPQGSGFEDKWFLSGDLAHRDAAGNFFFLGRRDDVINAGGYKISPFEIEAALNKHPAVAESAVVELHLEKGKSLVQAFVALKPGFLATRETSELILNFAKESLAAYKLPRELVFLRELPKSFNGKIQRNKLR